MKSKWSCLLTVDFLILQMCVIYRVAETDSTPTTSADNSSTSAISTLTPTISGSISLTNTNSLSTTSVNPTFSTLPSTQPTVNNTGNVTSLASTTTSAAAATPPSTTVTDTKTSSTTAQSSASITPNVASSSSATTSTASSVSSSTLQTVSTISLNESSLDFNLTPTTLLPGVRGTASPNPTPGPRSAEKSVKGYDRELAIIFGSACGLMFIVIIALCISRQRHIKRQKKFISGGDGIEITTSKF